jgi:ribosomal protein S18 acetylase RimI-like enzyme
MDHPLDNPVWTALTAGPHAALARGSGRARHYPREMAPFSAIAEASAEAYADLARSLAPGCEARLFRPSAEESLPPGWEALSVRAILQMVCDDPGLLPRMPEEATIPLGPADADDMLALAEAAKPGPFGRDTVALGRYLGVRRAGRLVAIAGERFRLPGFTELSGIGTAPEARGQGLASALTLGLARAVFARGEIPFLHVFPENRPAVGVYGRLGFRTRTTLYVVWRRPLLP